MVLTKRRLCAGCVVREGDMGVYSWNNMQNLYQDVVVDQTADLIIHNGDHAYNQGDLDELRGDGYMQAYEQVLANAPWMP